MTSRSRRSLGAVSSRLAKGFLLGPGPGCSRTAGPLLYGSDGPLLSRKELAAALGVSTRTVDRWIQEQTGPPATLLPSGRRRWRWGDVEAWLRQRREEG
jgi:predicted DNA-binding transcriptional regulator AlpA